MECLSLLSFIAVFLLNICLNRVSCAVTPVFVKKGDNVLLNVTGVPKGFLFLSWKFRTGAVLVSFVSGSHPVTGPKYSGRVESDVNNFSVKLKNLLQSDSGVYTARVTAAEEKILAEYNVTVQDPVSPVRLTVVPSSSDFCSITATCSTEDSHISSTFLCENKTCYQEGGNGSEITKAGASLQLYLSNQSVICTHSNQVSQAKQEKWILDFCQFRGGSSDYRYIPIVIGVAVVVVFASILVLLVCYHRKKRKYDRKNVENTVYASPEVETVQTHDESSAQDAAGSPQTTMYSTVGFAKGMGSTETKAKPQPETIYAAVQKPTRT